MDVDSPHNCPNSELASSAQQIETDKHERKLDVDKEDDDTKGEEVE